MMLQYTLPHDAEGAWVTVDGFAVYIKKTDEGVVVDIYPASKEGDSIASAYAFNDEVEADDETN